MILSDEELLRKVCAGDRISFTDLYNRYWKRLYQYAYKILEDELACEDIVQEVFIRLWERASTVEIHNLEAYLIQSINYRVANVFRRLKFSAAHEEALISIPSPRSADQEMEISELEHMLDKGINLLPDKCREVFLLSRKDHLSNLEIARRLNLSVRTVETHLYRALQILRSHLGEVYPVLITLVASGLIVCYKI